MTIRATFVRKLDHWRADARLYKLSAPAPIRDLPDDELLDTAHDTLVRLGHPDPRLTDHVIVSAADVESSGPEVLIFPARANGEAIDMSEIGGGRGDLDHEKAIREMGWEVAP